MTECDPVDSYSEWKFALKENLRQSVDNPDDIMLGAFAEAFLEKMDEPGIDFMLDTMYLARHTKTPGHARKMLERGYTGAYIAHNSDLEALQKPATWTKLIEEIEADNHRDEMFTINLASRTLQSNVAERYKTVHLIAALSKERFPRPTHLDVGASVLQGSIKLAYASDPQQPSISFSPFEVVSDRNTEIIDQKMSCLAGLALSQTVEYDSLVAVDLMNAQDEAIRHWAKNCTFWPSELQSSEKLREYTLLEELASRNDKVRFEVVDFALPGAHIAVEPYKPAEGFDIITFSTILYQLTVSERRIMLSNAKKLLSKDGLIIIQDDLSGRFNDFAYTASVIDSRKKKAGRQNLIRWKNGRCTVGELQQGTMYFRHNEQTLEQALESTVF